MYDRYAAIHFSDVPWRTAPGAFDRAAAEAGSGNPFIVVDLPTGLDVSAWTDVETARAEAARRNAIICAGHGATVGPFEIEAAVVIDGATYCAPCAPGSGHTRASCKWRLASDCPACLREASQNAAR